MLHRHMVVVDGEVQPRKSGQLQQHVQANGCVHGPVPQSLGSSARERLCTVCWRWEEQFVAQRSVGHAE
jgi:hypothetical protein